MQTLTISVNVPDELVHRYRTLPESDRRDFLQKMNAFAVSTLAGKSDDAAVTAADVEALHESLAQAGRGQILDGPTVMRELFGQRAAI